MSVAASGASAPSASTVRTSTPTSTMRAATPASPTSMETAPATAPTPAVISMRIPSATYPNPAAVPSPISRCPIVIRPGSDRHDLGLQWRRLSPLLWNQRRRGNLCVPGREVGLRRRWSNGLTRRRLASRRIRLLIIIELRGRLIWSLIAQGSVMGQHRCQNSRGNPLFLEVKNIIGRKAVIRARILDIRDNYIVPNARFGQFKHFSHVPRGFGNRNNGRGG